MSVRWSRSSAVVLLALLALLCLGNTVDTYPLYPMELQPEDLKTKEVPGWVATWVVKPRYSWMEPFFSGLALVADGGACENILKCTDVQWGAIDANGLEVVKPSWDRIRMTWPAVRFEVDLDEKKGLLSRSGKMLTPGQHDAVDVDANGFIRVLQTGGAYDIYNPDGRLIQAGVAFSSGAGPERVWIQRAGRWGMFSREGKQVVPYRYGEVNLSDGPAYPVQAGRLWGVIDGRGRQLAPFSYTAIDHVNGKLLLVHQGGTCPSGYSSCRGGARGVLNLRGKPVLPVAYECLRVFENDDGSAEILAMLKPKTRAARDEPCSRGTWQAFDGDGKPLFPDQFAYIDHFYGRKYTRAMRTGTCSAAGVCTGGRWGAVDRAGKVVVPFRYDWLEGPDEVNGSAFVIGGKWGFLDAGLREVVAAKYDQLNVDEGAVRFRENGKWGLMSPTGKVLVTPRYERILTFRDKVARFSEKGRWGLLSADGRVIAPAGFSVLCRQGIGTYVFSRSSGCMVPSKKYDRDRITPAAGAPIQRGERGDDDCECKGASFGLLDLAGRELFPARYAMIMVATSRMVSEAVAKASSDVKPVAMPPGEAWVRLNAGGACDQRECRGGKWGLADLRGNLLIPVSYAFVTTETDFIVRVAEGGSCDGNWFPSRCGPKTRWGLMKLAQSVK